LIPGDLRNDLPSDRIVATVCPPPKLSLFLFGTLHGAAVIPLIPPHSRLASFSSHSFDISQSNTFSTPQNFPLSPQTCPPLSEQPRFHLPRLRKLRPPFHASCSSLLLFVVDETLYSTTGPSFNIGGPLFDSRSGFSVTGIPEVRTPPNGFPESPLSTCVQLSRDLSALPFSADVTVVRISPADV